jgi:hypothetical protein
MTEDVIESWVLHSQAFGLTQRPGFGVRFRVSQAIGRMETGILENRLFLHCIFLSMVLTETHGSER